LYGSGDFKVSRFHDARFQDYIWPLERVLVVPEADRIFRNFGVFHDLKGKCSLRACRAIAHRATAGIFRSLVFHNDDDFDRDAGESIPDFSPLGP
jgi:hypothetical protein